MYFVNTQRLFANQALTSGVAVNSKAINVERNVGFFSIVAKEDIAGGAGDVDIYAEYSADNGVTWHRANTTASGTLTQEANIVTQLTNGTKWITFTARLAQLVRIVVDPDADSQLTLDFIYQEDL